MPEFDEIIHSYFNRERKKKRECGRYWASDIYSIRKGYLTPTNFFRQKAVDEQGGLNIFWGCAGEAQLDKILMEESVDYKTQERFDIKIDDFNLSGKSDFSFPNFILETKCPKDYTAGIPEKWKDQLECYVRAFKKPVKLGIFYKDGSKIIQFFSYEPSEERWLDIQELLRDFHKKLIKKHK